MGKHEMALPWPAQERGLKGAWDDPIPGLGAAYAAAERLFFAAQVVFFAGQVVVAAAVLAALALLLAVLRGNAGAPWDGFALRLALVGALAFGAWVIYHAFSGVGTRRMDDDGAELIVEKL